MPFLTVYVDDRTMEALKEFSEKDGRSVEDLAEAAVADAALRSLPDSPKRQP
jgi:hypothetical protein